VTLGVNQRRQVLRHKRIQLGHQQRRCILTSMRLQYEIIGNGLYSPLPIQQRSVTDLKLPAIDRALIGNGLYKTVTDRFNICNGISLTSVTKNSCNGHLRRPLPNVHIGKWHCGGQPRGRPGVLIGNGRQTTTVTNVGGCNRR
jgi:hypothetical protein